MYFQNYIQLKEIEPQYQNNNKENKIDNNISNFIFLQ